MNWLKKFWQLYKTQIRFVKLTDIFTTTNRADRRVQGWRWLRKGKPRCKLTRGQRQRLAAKKIEPPKFTGFNPKRSRRYMKRWFKRMQEAAREKQNARSI